MIASLWMSASLEIFVSLTASVEHLRQGRLVEGQPVRLVGDPRVDARMHRLPEEGYMRVVPV